MKRIIAWLITLMMLIGGTAVAEDISAYVSESGMPIVTDPSGLETMDILWIANPLAQKEGREIPWVKWNEERTGMVFN